MTTTTIRIDTDLHADLMTLKGIRGVRNMSALIRELVEARGYSEEFFERIREKVSE